ncbi:hypothetical protein SAMN06265182_0391 [Persephonella hydrogeniphila]|uniref:Uncharacterized protein n=1 Tax=Persephonella hydrogeniphila TaxID=198703 RepID=A0A285N6Z0_9AQUI|nr:hypothetical protein [Persephonella hydrogeniphila]SNZ03481.1 hypothetical protein SAMN06265182_0391 [Persephonella hydrogeniphila]
MRSILFFVFIIFACLLSTGFSRDIYHRSYIGKQDGLKIYNFRIHGKEFTVGSTVAVSFQVKNISGKNIKFGRYGIFIGCRDPEGKNRDFGHSYRNYVLKKGKSIAVSGVITIDKPGEWIFWPAFYKSNGEWSFYKWHAVKLKANRVLTIKPPYINCDGWKKIEGIGKAKYLCNPKTGFMGIMMGVDPGTAGGVATEVRQYIKIYFPKTGKIKIKAIIEYIGGAKTVGYGAFAGLQATSKYKKYYKRKDIEPGLNYEIAAEKIIDVALLAVPEGGGAKTAWQALKVLDEVKTYYDIAMAFKDAIDKLHGRRYTYSFTMKGKKGFHIVGIGIRGNCSAVLSGGSFVIVGALLKEIKVYY